MTAAGRDDGPIGGSGDDDVVRTYRYLRLSLVGLAVLLALSVAIESMRSGMLQGSISDYVYTPARGVLVGVLIASGVCLIAIKGRGVEDVLLNLAGMLAPLVAIVPTPLVSGDGDDRRRFVPADAIPGVDNGVTSLLVLGALGLAFATWTASSRTGTHRRQALVGVVGGTGVVVVVAVWRAVAPDGFLLNAHYVAAVGLFGIFVLVAWLNARAVARRDDRCVVQMLPARRRALLYRVIGWAMLATVGIAGVLAALTASGTEVWAHWLLVVETVLLVLFAAFWTLQTIEYWDDGLPAD